MKKSYSQAAFLLVTLSFLGCSAQRPVTEKFTPWGTYLFNDARTNATTDKVTLPLVLYWTKDISDFKILRAFPKEQLSSPALSKGTLYVGSTDDRLYSFDLRSGKVLWKFDARYPIEATPAVSGDTVCFGSSNGLLRCFESQNGKEIWHFQARSEILSSPVIKDDRVYFNSSDDRLYALSAKTGEKLWTYSRSTFQSVAPRLYVSPAYYEGKIYQLFSDGFLVCISPESGKEIWSKKVIKNFDSAEQTRRTPLVDNGLVYIIDENGAIQALNAEDGEVKNIFNLIKADDFVLFDKRMLLIAGSDRVMAIDRVTGSILWKKELKSTPLSSIFAADEYLFVLTDYERPLIFSWFKRTYGRITALRIKDGSEVWDEKLKSGITANASSGESFVSLLTNKGIFEVYGPK